MSSVSTMLGLPVDHYVAVDMDGLAALIDALGGVTVDVGPEPLAIGGVTYSGRRVTPDGYVPAGVQHLDGEQALWFARSRRDSDDYDRMARQRCLINAVLAQKRPSDVVARFRTIAAAAESSITTNIPQTLLPALLDLADEHRSLRLRSVSFDPSLRDPAAEDGRFDPADPDVGFMRRVVRAALSPPATVAVPPPTTASAPTPEPAPNPVPAPETVSTACAASAH
jgi:LytR_cpsA_psr family